MTLLLLTMTRSNRISLFTLAARGAPGGGLRVRAALPERCPRVPRCCCRSSRCRAASWPRVVLHRPRRRLPARGGVRASSPRSDSDIQQIVLHHTYIPHPACKLPSYEPDKARCLQRSSAVPIDHIRGCRPQLYHQRGAPAVAHGGDVVPLLGVEEQRVAHLRSGPGPGRGLRGACWARQGSLGSQGRAVGLRLR